MPIVESIEGDRVRLALRYRVFQKQNGTGGFVLSARGRDGRELRVDCGRGHPQDSTAADGLFLMPDGAFLDRASLGSTADTAPRAECRIDAPLGELGEIVLSAGDWAPLEWTREMASEARGQPCPGAQRRVVLLGSGRLASAE